MAELGIFFLLVVIFMAGMTVGYFYGRSDEAAERETSERFDRLRDDALSSSEAAHRIAERLRAQLHDGHSTGPLH